MRRVKAARVRTPNHMQAILSILLPANTPAAPKTWFDDWNKGFVEDSKGRRRRVRVIFDD